jgi:hypothetical protein
MLAMLHNGIFRPGCGVIRSEFPMGMFDYYEPVPSLSCPVCGHALTEWQGKSGPCGLFIWRQGYTAPIGQSVDDEVKLSSEELSQWRLPAEFDLYSYDCPCPFPVDAIGRTQDGVWMVTELQPIDYDRDRRIREFLKRYIG